MGISIGMGRSLWMGRSTPLPSSRLAAAQRIMWFRLVLDSWMLELVETILFTQCSSSSTGFDRIGLACWEGSTLVSRASIYFGCWTSLLIDLKLQFIFLLSL